MPPVTTVKPANDFVRHLDDLINSSAKSQRQIALEMGYDKANMITMFKQGTTRVPLDKVPYLADSLEVDRADMIRLWLQSYEPNLLEVLNDNLGMALSRSERSWVINLRKHFPGGVPAWDERSEDRIKSLARS